MKIAIVTGASSGLGKEYVRQLGAKEDLDEIWVIARREERLIALKEICKTHIVPIALDLMEAASFDHVKRVLEEVKPDVRVLVNAAGFGKIGDYRSISVADSDGMIDLNCRALVNMTLAALPYMRKGARILQIGSSSSFQPLPSLGIYAATKAFVLRYSRALRWELFGRDIFVTAVCPYWIKDTEFIGVSKDTKNGGQAIKHFPLASKTESVVRWSLFDSKLNLPVSTPGIVCFFQRILAKFIPHEIVIACWQLIRRV